ncbi:MAG TPA: hypothetical protein VFH51_18525 [Myxococcota bacterium]|nr:hypothetical protein [Myxococcota bacterium]
MRTFLKLLLAAAWLWIQGCGTEKSRCQCDAGDDHVAELDDGTCPSYSYHVETARPVTTDACLEVMDL